MIDASAQSRNQTIDVFRGALVLSVIAYHYLVFWAPPFTQTNVYGYTGQYPFELGICRFGVHVFFVISGIVITMTVLRSRGPLEFMWRRFSRLIPTLIVCCSLTYIFTKLLPIGVFRPSVRDYLLSLTLMPEKLNATPVDGSYWSLGVEIRFYALVAIFNYFLGKKFWIGLLGVAALAILQDFTGIKFTDYYLVGAYICYFLIGISFWYFVFDKQPIPAWSTFSVGVFILLLRYQAHNNHGHQAHLTNAVLLGTIALMFVSIQRNLGRFLYPLARIGTISYPLYLLHQTIGVTIIHLAKVQHWPDLFAVGIALAVAMALATAVHYAVELPAQNWLRAAFKRIVTGQAYPTEDVKGLALDERSR